MFWLFIHSSQFGFGRPFSISCFGHIFCLTSAPSYSMAVTLLRLPKLCRDLIGASRSEIAPPASVDSLCSEVDVLGLRVATIFAWFEFSFNWCVSLGPVLDSHIYPNGRYPIKTTYFMSGLWICLQLKNTIVTKVSGSPSLVLFLTISEKIVRVIAF